MQSKQSFGAGVRAWCSAFIVSVCFFLSSRDGSKKAKTTNFLTLRIAVVRFFNKRTLTVFLLLVVSVSMIGQTQTASAATEPINYNSTTIWGDSSTTWAIYGYDLLNSKSFEPDSDVETRINADNVLTLFDSNIDFQGLTIDWTESSVGKHAEDWTSDTVDTDLGGGIDYWMLNASVPSETSAAGDGVTWTTSGTLTQPPQGGYSLTIAGTNAEASENSDNDYEAKYWVIDPNEIDVGLTSDSMVYFNLDVQFAGVNETKDTLVQVILVVEDANGANQISISYNFNAGYTDDTAWIDGSDSILWTQWIAEEEAIYWRYDVGAGSTSEEVVSYWNIEDIIQATSAAYPTFAPARVHSLGVMIGSAYAGEAATVEIKQLMIVDQEKALSLFESTKLTDTATQRNDNYPNSTSRTISEADKYVLEDALELALDVPLNKLTVSAYTPVISAGTSAFTSKSDSPLEVTRRDVFDTDFPSDEGAIEPSTWYLNISTLDTSREILQISVAGDDAFDSNAKLESSWSISDENGNPSIDEQTDIYKDFSAIDVPLIVTPKTAITNTNQLNVDTKYEITADDYEKIDPTEIWNKELAFGFTWGQIGVVVGGFFILSLVWYTGAEGALLKGLGKTSALIPVVGMTLQAFFDWLAGLTKGKWDDVLIGVAVIAVILYMFGLVTF